MKQKQTGCQGGSGGRGGTDWELKISRCKLLHRNWINNKALLYSTGDSIQYSVINRKGEDYRKVCVCVCVNKTVDYKEIKPVNPKGNQP